MRGPKTRQQFAAVLRDARHRSGLSLRALAKQVGLSASTLQGWFEGKHLPTPALQDEFLALVQVLGLDADIPEEEWSLALGRLRGLGQVGANPYVGMQSYARDDADRFFGRDTLVDELVAAITADHTVPGPHLVAVVGISGAGKSSLLQAGLLGRACRPGGPLGHLSCEVVEPEALPAWTPPDDGPVLLVVDHLERLRAAGPIAEEAALTVLGSLLEHITVVFGLAADAFALFAADARLRRALAAPVLVGALTGDEFEQIIREPARASGRPVDNALTALILRDLWRYGESSPSVLPLLSNSLRQSWEEAQGPAVTVDDYLATGGLWGSLERLAERIHEEASPEGRRQIRALFLDLVQVSSDGIERRAVDVSLLDDDALAVAEEYLNVRLLTLEDNLLRISHSALLGRWARLGAWVEEEREQLLFRRRITKAAEVWEESNRDPHALIPVEALVFDQFARTSDIALTPLEVDFFEASVARAEQESEQHRREIGQLRRRNVVMSVLALIAVAGLFLSSVMVHRAESFRLTADESRAQAQSRQLALIAEETRSTDRNLAAQLSLAAYRTAGTLEAEAAVLKSAGLQAPRRILGEPGTVRLASSGDGLLLRATAEGTVEGWSDEDFDAPRFTIDATEGQLFGLAYGHDEGRQLIGVTGQGTASVWDVTDEPRKVGEYGADTVAYSAAIGGGCAYLGMLDGTIQRVDLATGTVREPLDTGLDVPADGLAVSPDGSLVVAAGGHQILAWTGDGAPLPSYPMERRVTRIQFSPDGRTLAVGGAHGSVVVLDVTAKGFAERSTTVFGAVAIHSLAYDGQRLFAGAWDGKVGAFTPDGVALGSFYEPSTVTGLAFHHDRIVTGAIDGAMRVWPQRYAGVLVEGSASSLPTALTGDHVVKYFDGYARLFHLDGSPEHSLTFTEDADTGFGPALISDHIVSLPSVSGRLASWDVEGEEGADPVWSQVADANAYDLFPGPDALAVYAESAKEYMIVIRRSGLTWERVTEIPTWSTLAAGWHPERPWFAAMSADSERLVIHDLTSSEATVLGEVEVPKHGAAVRLAWTPDGAGIVVGTDGGLVFRVDVSPDGTPTIQGDEVRLSAGVASLAISDDGATVAAGLLDGRIHVWDVTDGGFGTRALLRPGRGAVAAIQLTGDDVVFATDAEGVYSWPLQVHRATRELCQSVGEALTVEEWERLVPGVPMIEQCPR